MAIQKTSLWRHKLYDWDISTCLYFNHFCHKQAINQFFAIISRLGDGVFWYSLGLVLPLIYGLYGAELFILLLCSGAVCLAIYKQLKRWLVRERPFIKSKDILKGCAPLDRYSFPSGHTMHATCFSTIILWHQPEFAFILVPFSILIAISRMVLGMHYPSDVICGAIMGIALGALANYYAVFGYLDFLV